MATILLGMVLYGNHAPAHVLWLVLVLVLGAITFASLGVAITAVIPNADAAPAIINIVVLPLVFLSGTFFPIGNRTLDNVSNCSPSGPSNRRCSPRSIPTTWPPTRRPGR